MYKTFINGINLEPQSLGQPSFFVFLLAHLSYISPSSNTIPQCIKGCFGVRADIAQVVLPRFTQMEGMECKT